MTYLSFRSTINIPDGHLSSSEAERFQQEAQTTERLTHPSIVRVFDFDVQDGIPFLIMEYAPNGSLRQCYPEGSIVSLPQIIPSIKQVASALQYAYEQKFSYRDVKPENMLKNVHFLRLASSCIKSLKTGNFLQVL